MSRGKRHMNNNGPYEEYHENGQLKKKGASRNGKKHGPVELYYNTGQLKLRGLSLIHI